MNDDKFKEIFENYKPELSSDFQFMTKLQRNIEAIEIAKQHNSAVLKRHRIAVVLAALSGFVAGVLMTLLLPLAYDWISSIRFLSPGLSAGSITVDSQMITWIVAAVMSGFTAYNAYVITVSVLPVKEK